jgi:hypothetical protein
MDGVGEYLNTVAQAHLKSLHLPLLVIPQAPHSTRHNIYGQHPLVLRVSDAFTNG